ncbi:hypothetical protein SUGI_0302360 [Cryptomeria japonica]|nr:hypothetical protein SUGI_0302360 [Cryptomeria japonica]
MVDLKLWLHANELHGTIPPTLSACRSLYDLGLTFNQLNGSIPPQLSLLTRLKFLYLGANNLTGSIPSELGALSQLQSLSISTNQLSGSIPPELGMLTHLQILSLWGNQLSGKIPKSLGNCSNLTMLYLSDNKLSGVVPMELDSLCSPQQLRRLLLQHNKLSGEIPVSLAGCEKLELNDLSYNKLGGSIPPYVVASLKHLVFYLNFSSNSLQGSLPLEISKISMAQAIDTSGNRLTGAIPDSLGDCTELEHLNLSHNAFEGPIPDSLSKLQNLQEMDLSSNSLSGSIPMSLQRLKTLQYMNVSFNNLSGEISEGGLFPNGSVITLFMRNPDLCGPKNLLIASMPKAGPRKTRTAQENSLINSEFDESNLLGVGNFGSVYKGILRDGKIVAIKALNLQNEEAHKSFNTECKVLGRIRHRNLIKIISAFSYPGFKGLVLQFASNGSLEKHLHPDRGDQEFNELGLSDCLNIAVDVAHGMEYLHHDCPLQIVHCDLKPSNVLLDANMTALVTDFGISRLTSTPNSIDSFSATTFALKGSIGYIAPEYGLRGMFLQREMFIVMEF